MPEDGTHKPPRVDYKAGQTRPGTLTHKEGEELRPPEPVDGWLPALPFATLERKHPEYDAEYWRICRALYAGGRSLLYDKKLMAKVFPQHPAELTPIYEERVKRAYYMNYCGEIIDFIVSGLVVSPVEVEGEDKELDDWYDDFFKDVSPPGGKKCPINRLLRKQILTALICKRAWSQADFPMMDREPSNRADQEQAGALDGYIVTHSPEHVYDWEVDDTGELLWVNVVVDEKKRVDISQGRHLVTRIYCIYNRDSWAHYEITFDPDKPPKAETPVKLQSDGEHSFKRVPLKPLELDEGLWAMSKLESLAREHFNKRCALSWAEYKSLFQERYEFQGAAEDMEQAPAIADDEARTVNQTRGIGYTQTRYAEDRVEYVGADPSSFEVALKSTRDLRDEMHRVMYQMALTFDNSASAQKRSAESKKEDKTAHAVVLAGLGEYMRDHARDITQLIVDGRGEDVTVVASGADRFENRVVSDLIEDAEVLENISIPSHTFQRKVKYQLAKAKLGTDASDDDLAAIEKELEQNIVAEQYDPAALLGQMEREEEMRAVDADSDGDDDDDDDDDDDEPRGRQSAPPSNGSQPPRGARGAAPRR